MSGLLHTIRKALASAGAVALPHENPAPVAETSIAQVQPAQPSEETSDAQFRQAAGRVISQLQRKQTESKYDLDAATRAAIVAQINAAGPPRNAYGFDTSGRAKNLDGTPYIPPSVSFVHSVTHSTDVKGGICVAKSGGIPVSSAPKEGISPAERRIRREAFAQYKASRLPD